jgi:hypothetical protein
MSIELIIPPIFVGRIGSRVDTPERNAGISHCGDSVFFRMNPKRQMAVRSSYPNEFDQGIPAELKAGLPKVHVLVTRLSEDVHLVLPVYRTNRPFWTEPMTDAEVSLAVQAMARKGGWDFEEMIDYMVKHSSDDLSEIIALLNSTVIH